MKLTILLAALGAVMTLNPLAAAPLKVYLMAGQSNMQGFCSELVVIELIEYIHF